MTFCDERANRYATQREAEEALAALEREIPYLRDAHLVVMQHMWG